MLFIQRNLKLKTLQMLLNGLIIFDEDGKLYTRLYDKRDDFDFPAVNFQYWSIIFLNPLHSVATRVGLGDDWWEIHLTWKTIQNAFSRILYTLRHLMKAKYNVKSCRWWKPCEMDLSHNCYLHETQFQFSISIYSINKWRKSPETCGSWTWTRTNIIIYKTTFT